MTAEDMDAPEDETDRLLSDDGHRRSRVPSLRQGQQLSGFDFSQPARREEGMHKRQ